MAVTQTTLASACTVGANTITVTSATGFSVSSPSTNPLMLLIESEYIGSINAVTGTTIGIQGRGWMGTRASAHNALAQVEVGLPSDFPNIPLAQVAPLPPGTPPIVNYSVTGAITIPSENTTITLNKAGVAAMTLAAPDKAANGLRLTILATSAQAHTVTNTTPGFNNAGASGDVATFGGAIGDNFVIEAQNGIWDIITSKNVTAA